MFSETKNIAKSAAISLPFESEGRDEEKSSEGESSITNSSKIAIRVQNLSKCYQIYNKPHDRLKQSLYPRLQRLIGQPAKQYHREFWALQDVSFEVKRGETVGIIGRNGSGKSTLLQIICGTLAPTSGSVETNGRIAALLELGSGFNPEFSGRENVYMNGAVLGLSKAEVDNRFDDIAAFADIGQFIEQPVKTYSSGMYVRLAFAVAVNVEPDILIVDEALAVGDMLFQAKCMIRLKEMMDNGATVLFVSHDIGTVRSLCQQSIYLQRGAVVCVGKASDVIDAYVAQMNMELNTALKPAAETSAYMDQNTMPASRPEKETFSEIKTLQVSTSAEIQFPAGHNRYGDGGARILDVKLLNSQGQPTDNLELHETFTIQVAVRFNRDMDNCAIGYSFRDLKGIMLLGGVTTSYPSFVASRAKSGELYVFEIKGVNVLAQDVYTLSIGIETPVVTNEQHVFEDILEHAVVFRSYFPSDRTAWFPARVWVPVEFSCMKIPTESM